MHELNTSKSIASLTVQFVPLKVVTSGAEWQKWATRYKSTGRMTPILYAVRADGKQLYGKSGGKSGIELAKFLEEILRNSGRAFNGQEMSVLRNAVSSAQAAINKDDIPTAIKSIGAVSKVGTPGDLGSYGGTAMEADALAKTFIEQGSQAIDQAVAKLDDPTTRFDGALALAEAKFIYAPLSEVAKKAKSAYRKANGDADKKLALKQADTIRRGLARLKRRGGEELAVRDLSRVVERYPDTPAAEVASRHIAEISGDASAILSADDPQASEKSTDPTAAAEKDPYRMWSDVTGKHKVKAKLLATADGSVELQTEKGRKISLEIEKLSDADQAWLQRNQGDDEEKD